MAFVQSSPSLFLQPYIMSYWAYQGAANTLLEDYTYPDGCQEVIFNIETEVLKQDSNGILSKNPAIEIIGQLTKPYMISAYGSQLYFGVRFHPHGFSSFSRTSIEDLKDQNIDAREIFSDDIVSFLEHCKSLDSFTHFVQYANRYFLKKSFDIATRLESYKLVSACIKTLQTTHHDLSIADLCKHYSVSQRWLQVQFKNYIGISPKTLQKIFRFNSGIHLLNGREQQLTDVAMESGYYDQAHFNREFKALSGVTPRAYRDRAHPINQHFLHTTKSRPTPD